MKGKIVRKVHIRTGPGKRFKSLGTVQIGRVLEFEKKVEGEALEGINLWYLLRNNQGKKQYYWSGAIDVESE
jgi:uncharacterized protein YgiM (DUF1202 family)